MPKYHVISPLQLDGQHYRRGDVIESSLALTQLVNQRVIKEIMPTPVEIAAPPPEEPLPPADQPAEAPSGRTHSKRNRQVDA